MRVISNFQTLVFLVFFLSTSIALGQQDKKIALQDVFTSLEQKFDYKFSFRNSDIETHIAEIPTANTFEESLAVLQQSTLFDFTLLSEKTVAVALKNTLETRCIELTDSATASVISTGFISTPFQLIQADARSKVNFLLPEEIVKIELSAPGYKKISVSSEILEKSKCTVIQLTETVELLSTILLQQYITQGIEKNTNGTIEINYDKFVVLPGMIEKDVFFSLKALPGVQSINENISYLNIRGGTNDQNLILWDGIKMYQNGHFFGLISAFNPNMTSRAQLTKNGTTAALGDGVSGTIELMTAPKVNTNLSASAGINFLSADAFIDVPLGKKASVQVSGRKSLNNLWSSPTYAAYFDKAFQNTEVLQNINEQYITETDFTFSDISMRLLVRPSEKDQVKFNFLVFNNDLTFSENTEMATIQDAVALRSGLSQNTLAGGLAYDRFWNEAMTTHVSIYGTNYELQATNGDLLNDQTLVQENHIEETSVSINHSIAINSNMNVLVGYQFMETGITSLREIDNPFFFEEIKNVMQRNSGFVQFQFNSKDQKTQLETGLRVNHYNKFDQLLWEPRIRFHQKFLENFALEVLGELKSQHTSQRIDLQKDFLGIENRRWILSIPGEIPLLQSQQLSAGLSYGKNGWLLDVEPYIKKVKGITTQSQGFQNQFQNVNAAGSYTVKGIDVLLNKTLGKHTLWLGYSYADNRYEFPSLEPSSFHNNLDITNTLTAGINYNLNKLNLSAGVNWHTGKPFTEAESLIANEDGSINFGFPNQERIRDYIRVDVSAIYDFKLSEKIDAMSGLSVWNLLNRNNHVRSFYNVEDDNQVQQIDDSALPITPNAVLRISF